MNAQLLLTMAAQTVLKKFDTKSDGSSLLLLLIINYSLFINNSCLKVFYIAR